MDIESYKAGADARAIGLRLTDNPHRGGITEESVAAYKAWLDGYLSVACPGVIDGEANDAS